MTDMPDSTFCEPGRLDALVPAPKSGSERFRSAKGDLGFGIADFWRWSTSDLTNNAMRGILAEFLVMRALGVRSDVRTEWDAYDLVTDEGVRVEVKSSAYIQTWHQRQLSRPSFSIGLRRGWDAATNTYYESACRAADVYVFALLHHKDKPTVDPLNVDQWTFYVMPTEVQNNRFPEGKTVSLTSLIKAGATGARFDKLKDVINGLFPAGSGRQSGENAD